MAKVLLIDDDKYLCGLIRDWLQAERYEVELIHEGIAASDLLKVATYDVIVLDWDLPGKKGIDILKDFRDRGGQTPVIMLTGKGSLNDKELGFNSGADDYVPKPVTVKELALRIKAILRRPAQIVNDVLRAGSVELDPNSHHLTKDGVPVHLQPRDFALLEFLMSHPNSVFNADVLLARVWQSDSEASPDALRTAIKRIRKKLDDSDDENNSIIETLPRIGYKIRTR